MKKIGIDARLFGTKHGGIGRYTENLIKRLEKIDTKNQYFIFLQKDNFNDYQPQNNNFKKVLANFKVYGFGEQLLFPLLLNKYKLDLVHFPHFNAPIFYFKRYIVTIHDLIISHYPNSRATTLNPWLYRVKLFFYRLVISLAAKKAEKIITVSEYSKKDIIKFLKINSGKIAVTYEGVDLPQEPKFDCENLKQYLNISGDFLLYVGSAYPHKNLNSLIKALKEIDNNYQLVLVGANNFFYKRLGEEIKKWGLDDRVIFTGYMDDNKLACLYKLASLYVFPSLIEGFGLPPLEAQSYGLPVVSSNATCLPEILGDSAVYFDPKNISDMATKINEVLNNEVLREQLVKEGRKNLEKYSWDNCVEKTLNYYSN